MRKELRAVDGVRQVRLERQTPRREDHQQGGRRGVRGERPKGWIFQIRFGGNQVDDDAAINKNYGPNVADYYSERFSKSSARWPRTSLPRRSTRSSPGPSMPRMRSSRSERCRMAISSSPEPPTARASRSTSGAQGRDVARLPGDATPRGRRPESGRHDRVARQDLRIADHQVRR